MPQKIAVRETNYPDWPLESLGVTNLKGQPKGSGKVTFKTGDRLLAGGVWGCTTGSFDITYGWDEMAYLLEGEVTIQQPSGEKLQVSQGEFFFVPKGTVTHWIVTKPVKKIFFLRVPEPLPD